MHLSKPLVLASQSPRRRELLRRIGFAFDVHAADVDETVPADMLPPAAVRHLALKKASAVAEAFPERITLGADTIVLWEAEILNKPVDAEDARRMLGKLSGTTHTVFTGIALIYPERGISISAHEETQVTFAPMTEEEISAYVATGSPLDKAGAYGIQDDLGALFIARIDGDYYNVVGLPLHRLYRLMRENFTDLVCF